MSKKILITGGAGFIGSHTADALLAAVYARLKAIPAATLDALGVHDIEADGAQLEPDAEAADTPLAVMSLRLTVSHSTPRNSLAPEPLT
jgi:nucleoside-diphosphate-sugar epimerase